MGRHGGKILGALLGVGAGLLAGGAWILVLLAAGLAAGALFDAWHDPQAFEEGDEPATAAELDADARRLFARHLARLLFHLARVDDGSLDPAEIGAADRFFEEQLGYGAEEIDEAFAAAREDERTLAEACRACAEATEPEERLLLLDGLFEIAAADGRVSPAELDELLAIANALAIDPADFDAVKERFLGEELRAYQALGVDERASAEEIKRAWKALAQRHHPDKVAHLGPRAAELASRRFAQIQQAYEAIRKQRRF